MKKFIIVTLLLFPLAALAKVGTKNLDRERVVHRVCTSIAVPVIGTDTTTATAGIVNYIGIQSGTATITKTSIPFLNQYAKIGFQIYDPVDGGPVTCSNVEIWGETATGVRNHETIATVSETASYSTYAYATLEKITIESCSGEAVNDHLMVFTSRHLHTGVVITNYKDVESVCVLDATLQCAALDNGTIYDIETAFDASASTIDVSTQMFGDTLSGGAGTVVAGHYDTVCTVVRPGQN